MPPTLSGLTLLSAMITPAVLISACGTLIFSTSNRLGRLVDRVRQLSSSIEQVLTNGELEFRELRRRELDLQLSINAKRTRLIQHSLTGFYLSVGAFVATTASIGGTAFVPALSWLPTALGIAGTLVLFYSSVLLIGEAQLAVRSLKSEMEFILKLRELIQTSPAKPASRK
jgi:hypothetical protein